ncbi:uncharacterized protein TrAFT101_001658 [Trichoderma asperellum]|uniref:uncharacterized protein n=1 Tax=Trichoderma asperellum TaxID=101201 RepID=UPI003329BB46|nr:hypothetical protein TrAFT101_001658 [Trichoderma asperellum]
MRKLFQDDYLCPVNYLYAPGYRLLQPASQITFVEAFTGANGPKPSMALGWKKIPW